MKENPFKTFINQRDHVKRIQERFARLSVVDRFFGKALQYMTYDNNICNETYFISEADMLALIDDIHRNCDQCADCLKGLEIPGDLENRLTLTAYADDIHYVLTFGEKYNEYTRKVEHYFDLLTTDGETYKRETFYKIVYLW